MNFFNPLAFIGLITIPAIIIMYLLKQKHKEIIIPSLKLWNKAVLLSQAEQPWQKLKKNLLLILQLLAALILVFAIAKPYLMGTQKASNYIILLDSSMSMKAQDEENSRFEAAKKKINEFISDIEPDASVSIISVEKNPYIAVNNSNNKSLIKKALKEIDVKDTDVDMEMTKSLLNLLYEESGGNVYLYSDTIYSELADFPINNILFGKSSTNTAISLVSHSINDGNVSILVKVNNYSNEIVAQSVTLYVDDLIYDTKSVELTANEETDVIFSKVPNCRKIEARIESKDIFPADDVGYDVINVSETKKVVLVTEQNLFLEKSLSIISNVELYKANSEQAESLSGYDLYIYDGIVPSTMPTDGHIFILNPTESNSLFNVIESTEINSILVRDNELLEFATDVDFDVLKAKKIEVPSWASVVIEGDEVPLVLYGEKENQKIVIFTFDLHDTDLPLKKEFPIFVYNLINWYMPNNALKESTIFAGELLELDLSPNVEGVNIVAHNGKNTVLAPPFPISPFSDTAQKGIYQVNQLISGDTVVNYFSVNHKQTESDLYRDETNLEYKYGDVKALGNKSIANWFIFVVLLILIVEWLLYKRSKLYKKKLIDFVRYAVVILIILSMFGFELKNYSDDTSTIFLADLSDSTYGNENKVASFILDAIKEKADEDFVGVISFGEYASVEKSLEGSLDYLSFDNSIKKGQTNIEKALNLAQVMLPDNRAKRIVLLSDGLENEGSALKQAKLLREQGIPVSVYPITNLLENEVQITQISVPQYINKDTKIQIEVIVNSLNNTEAELRLFKDNTLSAQEKVKIYKGENRFVFSDIADIGGHVVYKAEISTDDDTFYQNNKAYSYSYVSDVPKVLILDKSDSGVEMEKLLISTGLSVERKTPFSVSQRIENIMGYDTIILADVNADELTEDFMTSLETYVKTVGGGLIVTGGNNSYALGGYQDTLLETILPVDMDLEDKNIQDNLAMVIVVDRSGSMTGGEYGVSKLSLAKEAVVRAIDTMQSKDFVGVLAFDSVGEWVVELQQIGDSKLNIENKVSSISAGGGTSILPSLEAAYKAISEIDAKLKHIILMTDGQAETNGYDKLVESMNTDNITLSTVAVGSDSDQRLLSYLADKGGGRYYFSTVFTDLPEIFAKETFLAGKTFLNNRDFYPVVSAYSPVLDEIEAIPSLKGYVATSAKPRADVVLKSDKDDPILATWQYGLGKAIAWTSDMDGQWSSEWLATDEGINIFRNMVAWSLKKQMNSDYSIKFEDDYIELTTKYEDIVSISATVVTPDMRQSEIIFRAVEPMVYRADFTEKAEGVYLINFTIERENNITENVVSGINKNYSEEYDIRNYSMGENLLSKIASVTEGKTISLPNEVFEKNIDRAYSQVDITLPLLITALLLFVFEIALRRFPIVCTTIELTVKRIGVILNRVSKKKVGTFRRNEKKKVVRENGKKKEKVKEEHNSLTSMSNSLLTNKKKRNG